MAGPVIAGRRRTSGHITWATAAGPDALLAVFQTEAELTTAITDLEQAGYPVARISVLGQGMSQNRHLVGLDARHTHAPRVGQMGRCVGLDLRIVHSPAGRGTRRWGVRPPPGRDGDPGRRGPGDGRRPAGPSLVRDRPRRDGRGRGSLRPVPPNLVREARPLSSRREGCPRWWSVSCALATRGQSGCGHRFRPRCWPDVPGGRSGRALIVGDSALGRPRLIAAAWGCADHRP
jgi:hypothetical protein